VQELSLLRTFSNFLCCHLLTTALERADPPSKITGQRAWSVRAEFISSAWKCYYWRRSLKKLHNLSKYDHARVRTSESTVWTRPKLWLSSDTQQHCTIVGYCRINETTVLFSSTWLKKEVNRATEHRLYTVLTTAERGCKLTVATLYTTSQLRSEMDTSLESLAQSTPTGLGCELSGYLNQRPHHATN
jgi:hypothetical protein